MKPPIRISFLSKSLVTDTLVGLSIAGLLLPEAVAYAGIANLPPQAGVIGLAIGLVCYGILGSSRFALVAATSSSAAVLAAAIRSLQPQDATQMIALAAGLVLLTGLLFVVAGALRIGRMANFIAKPVLRGFVFGLSIVIALKQFAAMIGVRSHRTGIVPMAYELANRWREWNIVGLGVGLVALVLLLAASRLRRIPGALIVIVLGIVAGTQLDLTERGVATVGTLQLSAASIALPQLDQYEWLRLSELAVALVLILFAESYGSIRTFALKHGDRVNIDRDLIALGIANLFSGLFHGTPVGAGFSATAANEATGARSRAAGLVAALTVVTVVALFLPQLAAIPEPVLAAIVIYAVRHSLTLQPLRPYLRWRRDRLVAVVAVAAVIVLGVLDGLLFAIATSLVMTLRALSQPRLSVLGRLADGHDFVALNAHPSARPVAGVLVLRPEEPLFFANAEPVFALAQEQLRGATDVHTVVLSLEESPDIDGTSIEALRDFSEFARRHGQRLLIARLKDRARDALMSAQLHDLIPAETEAFSVDDVVTAAALRGK